MTFTSFHMTSFKEECFMPWGKNKSVFPTPITWRSEEQKRDTNYYIVFAMWQAESTCFSASTLHLLGDITLSIPEEEPEP